MKIGLIDVDSHNFPNLCLMKISTYHKAKGDTVEWWNGLEHYDIVYKSRVFTDEYTQDETTAINADKVIQGGTGYDLKNVLPPEIENQYPDYPLYGENMAYGFLTRGCPRGCGFCIVGKKEGLCSRKVSDLSGFWRGQKEIKLLDPNLLACQEHEDLLKRLAESGAWVDFTQGLDIRLINEDNVNLLNRIKTKMIHFAWDNPKQDLTAYFERFNKLSKVTEMRKKKVYVLTNFNSTHQEDLYRVETLKKLDYDPYIMIYNKFSAPIKTRHLQRWVNNKIIFRSCERFEDYNPKMG